MSAPRGEKPYRVYRGGRVKGKVPTIPRPTRERGGDGDGRRDYRGPGAKQPKTGLRGWSWKRWTALSVLVLLLVFILWTVVGYLSFRSGVKDANKRLPESARLALVPDKGMILSHPTDILLLGTDHSLNASRASDQHSDSIQILRTDPKHHKLIYLSIPRDLRVPDIPGHGPDKINAAFQIGGARLAERTVQAYTGLPINHVVVVNFHSFAKLIDKLGGIDINVPQPIPLEQVRLPLLDQRALRTLEGLALPEGRAAHERLPRPDLLARPREPAQPGRHGHHARGAAAGRCAGADVQALRRGHVLQAPLHRRRSDEAARDRSVADGAGADRLAEVPRRTTLHCRLGGTGDGGYIDPSEDNAAVIAMVKGESAPQPPPPNGDTYPPGCYVNRLPPGG
jgi:LCP family protein required for cell wall assembly